MRFPMFVEIENKKILVVGGGEVGMRRTEVLRSFGADVTLISENLKNVKIPEGTKYINRSFEDSDICDGEDYFFVTAATNDRDVNHRIYELCKERNIPVSVCDCPEESTFFFPAVCKNDKLSVGIVSDGTHHELVRRTAEKIREVL